MEGKFNTVMVKITPCLPPFFRETPRTVGRTLQVGQGYFAPTFVAGKDVSEHA